MLNIGLFIIFGLAIAGQWLAYMGLSDRLKRLANRLGVDEDQETFK